MTTLTSSGTPSEIRNSLPERFEKRDFVAGGYVFFLTFLVYMLTLAPNVTLEDSGELITGAVTFGVPHPPGYPLWTLSGFIFSHLIPFGNLSWRVNIQSAFYGAGANAIITLLVAHSSRWLLQRWVSPERQPTLRPYSFYAAIATGLTLGFSDVMWSQAVIAEVYSLNAFFLSLVLISFYFWILRPELTDRLLICVFFVGVGLTNHHTLVQVIPAFLAASFLLCVFKWFQPLFVAKSSDSFWESFWAIDVFGSTAEAFWSLLIAVSFFSLSVLAFISWLSREEVPGSSSPILSFIESVITATPHVDHNLHTKSLHTVAEMMAWIIMILTLVVSIFYLKFFSAKRFMLGVGITFAIFLYGHYCWAPAPPPGVDPTPAVEAAYQTRDSFNINHFWTWGSFTHSGWSQFSPAIIPMFILIAVTMGCLYTSLLNWRLIQGMFFAGWLGLIPYSYELLASSTHPPMNWGYVSSPGGFYYAVSRAQYPMSLPDLINGTIAKRLGVTTQEDINDPGMDKTGYGIRLFHTFQYFGEDAVDGFCIPLILFPVLFLIYWLRSDLVQWVWILFLGAAFFSLGFLLHVISPPQSFDVLTGLNYKVFFLQAHCILMIFMGYGIMAGIVFLYEVLDGELLKYGPPLLGSPFIFLSFIPLMHNFDDCNQAEHWFGWQYGYDMINPLPKNAIFFGGNDPGRFVPTYMIFVESQQSNYWKRDPAFDRRDVFVITQNALIDSHYLRYIEDQYDARFRPTSWTPFEKWLGRETNYPTETINLPTVAEQNKMWSDYYSSPRAMKHAGGSLPQEDLFYTNGIIAKMIFDRNQDHEFYLEQSTMIDWMQPYMVPDGLIFKLAHKPLDKIPPEVWAKDHQFWINYAGHLLGNPNFLVDQDATHWYATLAFNRALLAQYRDLPEEVEFYDKLSILLCPYYFEPVLSLAGLYHHENRYDDAIAVLKEAQINDPRNEIYPIDLKTYYKMKDAYADEQVLKDKLKQDPKNVLTMLNLAKNLELQDKMPGAVECLAGAASVGTNWNPDSEGAIIHYYSPQVLPREGETAKETRPEAVLVFLRTRQKYEPNVPNIPLFMAKEELLMGDVPAALNDLRSCFYLGGEIAQQSCASDPFLQPLQGLPEFQKLLHTDPKLLVPLPSQAKTPSQPTPLLPATNTTQVSPPSSNAESAQSLKSTHTTHKHKSE